MRRAAILCAVCGLIASGLGCRVVTGQHDCLYDPASATLPPTDGKLPYAPVGGSISGTGVVTAAPPAVMELPKADKPKDGGK